MRLQGADNENAEAETAGKTVNLAKNKTRLAISLAPA